TLHTKLKKWCNLTAAERDLPEVAMAPVLRLLVEELLVNKELAETIGIGLTDQYEEAQRNR
ncbi:hypothetical protein, partial [Kitasatospora sp. NPDC058478]|uniref:hypothetical protein n=1 Tax=Kitasatospora sp. NPDC058478 TaxID=3346520 RepID=UPI003657278A